MKLGISTYTLTWSIGVPGYDRPQRPLTATDLIAIAKNIGLGLVQFADNIPLHLLPVEEQDELQQYAAESGIDVEVGTRGTEPDHLLRYMDIAHQFASPLLRTLITTPDIGLAAEQIKQVLPQFAERGIILAVENHGLHTTRELTGLFDALDSPYIGSCLDTVNSFSALECPDKVIRELVPYIVNLHIKDFDIKRADHQMGFVVSGTPAGSGKLDIPSLMKIIGQSGRRPSAILELWTPYQGTTEETAQLEKEWMAQSVDFLKQLPFQS